LALVSLGVGFLAAFLGAVFFAAGFAAVFFSGAAEADLADFLATDFLAGAFFFVAGFAAVFFGDALLAAGFLTAFSTGFLDGGFGVFFFAPIALDCAGVLAFLADAFFVAVFFATFFLVCAFAIPFISIS